VQDLDVAAVFANFTDFVYYAHYRSHTEETLELMNAAIQGFRDEVEQHLFDFNTSEFTTPKYHLVQHYPEFVRMFGSLLNGDTEIPERLHVGIKDAYKRTNKKGKWLQQLARNLDELFLVEQLYQQTEIQKDNIPVRHSTLKGIAQRAKKLSLNDSEIVEVI
jgi:hypothetical protein